MEFGLEEGPGTVKGFSACDFRLLRLQMKKNRARRSEIRTSPPITPPMIAAVGLLLMVVEGLGGEIDELPDGMLVEVRVLFEDVEDGASS